MTITPKIIGIDKPTGITSAKLVYKVKKILNVKKIGHCGTLDPLATGILLMVINEATKFSQYIVDVDKTYKVEALLGVDTDTYDIMGNIVAEKTVPSLSEKNIIDALQSLVGNHEILPPYCSAIKYKGIPLYKMMRRGNEMPKEIKPRKVFVYDIKFLCYNLKNSKVEFTVYCAKGTYIRSLVYKLGQLLGCGACVSKLRRIACGKVNDKQIYSLEEVQNKFINGSLFKEYIQVDDLLTFCDLSINKEQFLKIKLGKSIIIDLPKEGIYKIYFLNNFIGLGEYKDNIINPKRLLSNELLNSLEL